MALKMRAGDTVRHVRGTSGMTGIVTKTFDGALPYEVKWDDGSTNYHHESELELLRPRDGGVLAQYTFFQSSQNHYSICTEPAQHPIYKDRVWLRVAVGLAAGEDDWGIRRLYESRDQALIAAGMLIETVEREARNG